MEQSGRIRVRNLNLAIGNQPILKNVNLDLPAGQITAIIGPSGCGKTTLLRCFNRLFESLEGVQVSGSVMIDDLEIMDANIEITEMRRRMGMLLQKPYPLPMSIYDNVAYGPRIHGRVKRRDLDQLVRHNLEQVGLWEEVRDRLQQPAARLSVGQQQRLCLARALAVKPEIILADEPTSALDPLSSRHIEEKFLEYRGRYTMVMVTHILRQARRLADYVVFLYLGEVIEAGPAERLFESPARDLTRDYVKGTFS